MRIAEILLNRIGGLADDLQAMKADVLQGSIREQVIIRLPGGELQQFLGGVEHVVQSLAIIFMRHIALRLQR